MATAPPPDDITRIIELVTLGDISIEDAARRLGWIDSGEAATCADCKWFIRGFCHMPGYPRREEQPDSIRCEDQYEKNDPRDYALPAEPERRGSRMWK